MRNLDALFQPRRVAVIGASNQPGKVGHTVVRNLLQSGFPGDLYPVNPKSSTVQGLPAFARLADLPHAPDLAIHCTPANTIVDLIRQGGEAHIRGHVILSAGFRETGAAGQILEAQLRAEARKFPGLRILGPNCLGLLVPGSKLNASFAADFPRPGRVAFLSQSGALCTAVLDRANAAGFGFSAFVSVGNLVDIDFGDLIDYLGQDAQTQSLILYLESLPNSRKFMSAARAFARTKPIVAYKAGRFAESARAAASHTGALAGEDAVFDAAFERAGIVRVDKIADIFDCAELLAGNKLPAGPRLAIVTNAGGPGVMATDALLSRNGKIAELTPATLAKLNEKLPDCWSHGNPVDVLGDAPPARYRDALAATLDDPQVDAVLVILTPQDLTDPSGSAQAVADVARPSRKPVLASWIGGPRVEAGIRALNAGGVPTYAAPEQAVGAFLDLVSYARNLEILYETPRDVPLEGTWDRVRVREQFLAWTANVPALLPEARSKAMLAAYGIPVTKTLDASTAEDAVAVAAELGFPVVLKIDAENLPHKSDVGGVALNLPDPAAVRAAFARLTASVRAQQPALQLRGVTVQPFVQLDHGLELILGAKLDPTFGAVILLGLGGIAAEVLRDRVLALPPLNERLARRMVESLRSWPLLRGYRQRPPLAVDKLIEILMRFSYLVAEHPEIRELDINPLVLSPDRGLALDARIYWQPGTKPLRPYAHLAICPYPEQWQRHVTLSDGQDVLLRPLRPEDEPAWHALLALCSPETIHARFRSMFRTTTHQMAARYCVMDYDREMAIAAELTGPHAKQIVGVGRLVADPDHEFAEFAVLVADPFQGRRLGVFLLEFCLEIAGHWGLRMVRAETDFDNHRMLALFRTHGFQLFHDSDSGVVKATKKLS